MIGRLHAERPGRGCRTIIDRAHADAGSCTLCERSDERGGAARLRVTDDVVLEKMGRWARLFAF